VEVVHDLVRGGRDQNTTTLDRHRRIFPRLPPAQLPSHPSRPISRPSSQLPPVLQSSKYSTMLPPSTSPSAYTSSHFFPKFDNESPSESSRLTSRATTTASSPPRCLAVTKKHSGHLVRKAASQTLLLECYLVNARQTTLNETASRAPRSANAATLIR